MMEAKEMSRRKAKHVLLCLALLACPALAQNSSQPQQSNETSPTSKATQPEPDRVHVEQAVSPGLLVHKVQPVYPKQAAKHHIQGTVVLEAHIGKDGIVRDLRVVSGPPELTKAALDAVKQWRYRPYLVNSEPVEVETTININFTLEGS